MVRSRAKELHVEAEAGSESKEERRAPKQKPQGGSGGLAAGAERREQASGTWGSKPKGELEPGEHRGAERRGGGRRLKGLRTTAQASLSVLQDLISIRSATPQGCPGSGGRRTHPTVAKAAERIDRAGHGETRALILRGSHSFMGDGLASYVGPPNNVQSGSDFQNAGHDSACLAQACTPRS